MQFLYDAQNPVQELQGGTPSANLLTGLGIDEDFNRMDSSGSMSFLTDSLGSTLALTDSNGNVATNYTYDPFGNASASGVSSANPFQFTGRENDYTGLNYYRGRFYSPLQQRFISQDPFGLLGGDIDLYSYVQNSPIGSKDPHGLCVEDGCIVEGGLAACLADPACAALLYAITEAAEQAAQNLLNKAAHPSSCDRDRNDGPDCKKASPFSFGPCRH
jgi:RHS repeat-associated protein